MFPLQDVSEYLPRPDGYSKSAVKSVPSVVIVHKATQYDSNLILLHGEVYPTVTGMSQPVARHRGG